MCEDGCIEKRRNVREYWIVDSEKQMVTVYGFESDIVEQYGFGDEVPVGIYEGFTINLE